jgi:hypothetical protein
MGQILSILWEILSILWEICYLIGILESFSNNFRQQFWKVSPENFFDNAGTIRKSRADFFPPPNFFLPVRPWQLGLEYEFFQIVYFSVSYM